MIDGTEGSVELANRYEELIPLVPRWRQWCDRSARVTPFQRPEWLLPWCRHLGPEELRAYVVRHRGEPIALAPFFCAGDCPRTLILAGTGVSDYVDIIVAPEPASIAYPLLFRALRADRGSWDACELSSLQAGSPSRLAASEPGFSDTVVQGPPSPVVTFPTGVDPDLAAAVPSRQLARYRKYRARARRAGSLVLELVSTDDAPGGFRAFAALHAACWRPRGAPGMLSEPRLVAFHEEVVRRTSETGALRLYLLRLDGRPIAGIYAFREKNTTYCYLQGYDPEFADLSPGTLALGHLLEAEVRAGTSRVDFLRGTEPYKYLWGASDEPTVQRTFRLSSSTSRT